MNNREFYKSARENSANMVARGLMKHAPVEPVDDERIAADCRRQRELDRIASARKKSKVPL